MSEIEISVIVPTYNSQQTIERCLTALSAQTHPSFEIVVVDSSEDRTAEIIAQKYPNIKLYRFSERKYPGDARNLAIAKAQGQILAFTDSDCVADKNWLAEISQAHQTSHPVIGGAVDIANPESLIAWAAYFCEFNQWLPLSATQTLKELQLIEIPTCCLSIKRWAYDKYGPFLEGTYCSDTAFHWKLNNAGYLPVFVPAMKISHINISKLGKFLAKELMHGRQFARVRVAEKEFSYLLRTIYFLSAPLLPLLLFYRMGRRVWRNHLYFNQFIKSSPIIFLGLLCWSLGEQIGYLLGAYKVTKNVAK